MDGGGAPPAPIAPAPMAPRPCSSDSSVLPLPGGAPPPPRKPGSCCCCWNCCGRLCCNGGWPRPRPPEWSCSSDCAMPAAGEAHRRQRKVQEPGVVNTQRKAHLHVAVAAWSTPSGDLPQPFAACRLCWGRGTDLPQRVLQVTTSAHLARREARQGQGRRHRPLAPPACVRAPAWPAGPPVPPAGRRRSRSGSWAAGRRRPAAGDQAWGTSVVSCAVHQS